MLYIQNLPLSPSFIIKLPQLRQVLFMELEGP